MKLLLHTCCAPCAIYPVNEAKKEGFDITGFFCNSNIHPQAEYNRRKEAAKEFFNSKGLELFFTTYSMGDFFGEVSSRCLACWKMRLKKTVSFTKTSGFDAFTTTLLGSPYQDHDALKRICEELSEREKVHFYYKDFRAGFKDARDYAKKEAIYRQKYCGCVFSMVDPGRR